jgi:hypothetical protein
MFCLHSDFLDSRAVQKMYMLWVDLMGEMSNLHPRELGMQM